MKSNVLHNLYAFLLDLVDFPVDYGIIRADKLRLHRRPVTLTPEASPFPALTQLEVYGKYLI